MTVKIKDSVAKSEHACWRLAILLHEIGHVIHFWTFTTPIYPEETHGADWMKTVKETMIRGGLKKCAMKLVSPNPTCLYKTPCIYCAPVKKFKKSVQKVYISPKVLEKSPFGGNCYFCMTNVKTIYHLRQSETCREGYEDWYGPQYKAVIKSLTYKENRVNRRVV